jgi:hypothetical protein
MNGTCKFAPGFKINFICTNNPTRIRQNNEYDIKIKYKLLLRRVRVASGKLDDKKTLKMFGHSSFLLFEFSLVSWFNTVVCTYKEFICSKLLCKSISLCIE